MSFEDHPLNTSRFADHKMGFGDPQTRGRGLRAGAIALVLPLVLSACAMSRFDAAGLSPPPAPGPGPASPVAPVQSEPMMPNTAAPAAPNTPLTKSSVVAFEYSASFSYVDLAARIDRAVQSCWIGKNPEFAGYSYGGMTQDKSRFIIALNETDNGQPASLVKVLVVPASGQDGYAVTLQSRAAGSPGEKTMTSGIRRIVTGQKVC